MAYLINALYVNGGDGATTGWYALTPWAAGATVAAGVLRRQLATPSSTNHRVFICIVAGTTGGSEPTWVVTVGAKTTDNTVTWQECSGQSALNNDITNTIASSSLRSTGIVLGQVIKNVAASFLFICTTAGTSGAGEPSYSTTTGATTADNTGTWTCIGAVGAFANWACPARSILAAFSTSSTFAITYYVASVHTETANSSYGGVFLTPAISTLLCVSAAGSVPPVSADITTGATISLAGLAISGPAEWIGFTFTSASSTYYGATNLVRLVNCSIVTTANTFITFGGITHGGLLDLVNTTVSWTAGGSGSLSFISWSGGNLRWRDTANAISYVGSLPTAVFSPSASYGLVELEGLDLSALNPINLIAQGSYLTRMVLTGCKINAATTGTTLSPQGSTSIGSFVDMINCDSGGAVYRHERAMAQGYQVTDATIYRSGGASDGTTAYGWRVVTPSAVLTPDQPFESLPIAIWNATTGSTVTLTIEGLFSAAALPTNGDIYLEAIFFGTVGSTRISRASGVKADFLASTSSYSASTATWHNGSTARGNSTVYTSGALILVSSNTGLVFVCTTGGTSSGSLPGGYASAVDGGSVTDGTAIFRAAMRFKMVLALSTPAIAGYIRAQVRVARISSLFWIDPYFTVS